MNKMTTSEWCALFQISPDDADVRGNFIHPSALVSESVVLGSGNVIGPNTIVMGSTVVGDQNIFSPGVVVGMPSRQRFRNDATKPSPSLSPEIYIGSRNIFYEYVSIHTPMKETTRIASDNCIGARNHISHDCQFGNEVVTAANSSFGGFCVVLDFANFGLGCAIHPRTVTGAYAHCGAGSSIVRHVAPGSKVAGTPARYLGVNSIGMKRCGFSPVDIAQWDSCLSDSASFPEHPLSRELELFSKWILETGRNVSVLRGAERNE